MDNFDPYNVLLAIATNIPQRLKTGFVLQGHIYHSKLMPYPHETPLTEYLWSGAVLTFTEVIILQRRQWSRRSDGDIKAPSPAELGLIEEQTAHLSEQWGLSDVLPGCRRNLLLTWRPRALLVTDGEGLFDDKCSNIDPSAWDTSSGSDSLIDNNSCFIRSISVALSGLLALVTALTCVCLKLQSVFSMMAEILDS